MEETLFNRAHCHKVSKRLHNLRTDDIRSKQVGVSSSGEIMATSYVRAEQWTEIQFCFDSRMTPLDTLNYVKQDEYHLNVSQALVYKLLLRFREGKSADERMEIPPLRNTGEGMEVESVVSNDRRQRCAT